MKTKHAYKKSDTSLQKLEAELARLKILRNELRAKGDKTVWLVEDAIKKCQFSITQKRVEDLQHEL